MRSAHVELAAFVLLATPSLLLAETSVTYPGILNSCTTPAGYADAALCTPLSPTNAMVLPPVGGTYTDSAFGTPVRILAGQAAGHSYATPSPFSASGAYVALYQNAQQVQVVDAASGRTLFSHRPGNVTSDAIRWDAANDDLYYWLDGTRVYRHRLSTNTTDVLIDYSTDALNRFTKVVAGGTGDTSKNNYLGFWAPNEHRVCTIELTSAKTYCADYLAAGVVQRVGVDFVDFVLVAKGTDSKTSKQYVVLMANPSIAVFSVNLSRKTLDFEYRGGELPDEQTFTGNRDGICDPGELCVRAHHGDTVEDEDGQQYLTGTLDISNPCARVITTYRLNAGYRLGITGSTGGRSGEFIVHRCGTSPYENWAVNHVGCAKKAPACVLSTEGPLLPTRDVNQSYSASTHLGEVLAFRANLSEVRRLALHRGISWPGDYAERYWSMPRAAVASDARQVIWDSNYGQPSGGTYVAIGYPEGRVPAPVCRRATPELLLVRASTPVYAGGDGSFTFNLMNRDTSGCGAQQFKISLSAPTGWTTTIDKPSFSLRPGDTATVQATYTVPQSALGSYNLRTVATGSSTTGSLSAPVIVTPGIASVTTSSPAVIYPGTLSGTVTLTGAAPAEGIVVALTSSSTAAKVPAQLIIPAGGLSASFTVTTTAVTADTSVVVTARTGTAPVRTVSITVQPPQLSILRLVPVNGSTVMGGQITGIRAELERAAPTADSIVFSSSAPDMAAIAGSVAVAAGQWDATAELRTQPVTAPTAVRVTATASGQSKFVDLQVVPVLVRLVFLPATFRPGTTVPVGFKLWAAPVTATPLTISTTCRGLTVPVNYVMRAGSDYSEFPVQTAADATQEWCTVSVAGAYNSVTLATQIVP